jgi:hypothetical protein
MAATLPGAASVEVSLFPKHINVLERGDEA